MSDIEIQLGHSNIADVVLQRIRNYSGKKRRKRKRKIQSFFWRWRGCFYYWKTCTDMIERCKLPKAVELRKKLGYNHDDIMV